MQHPINDVRSYNHYAERLEWRNGKRRYLIFKLTQLELCYGYDALVASTGQ